MTAASSGASSSIRSVVDEQQARPVTGAGAATQLVFLTEPGNGTAGSNLSPEPAVAVEDEEGNIVYSDLSDVKLTISGGTSGATLSNSCTGSEFYGVVTFSDCSVNMAGTGYSLTATDGGLQSAASSTFNVTAGAALQAAITSAPLDVVPASSASGNPITGASPIAVNLFLDDARWWDGRVRLQLWWVLARQCVATGQHTVCHRLQRLLRGPQVAGHHRLGDRNDLGTADRNHHLDGITRNDHTDICRQRCVPTPAC